MITKNWNVSINNVNGLLTRLYYYRDVVLGGMDPYPVNFDCGDFEGLEMTFDETITAIEELCDFRRNHKGCLLEGDDEFSFY